MKGMYKLFIKNKKVEYSLLLKRKFTIIRGDSATGKTYLAYLSSIKDGSVIVKSDVPVSVNIDEEDFVSVLSSVTNRIVILDEDSVAFKGIKEYQDVMLKANVYFVLITRSKLNWIPYSLKEVYTIVNNDGVNTLKQENAILPNEDIDGDIYILEDSVSGNMFYREALPNKEIFPNIKINDTVLSKGGKSNVKKIYLRLAETGKLKNKKVVIIVDSAAFGCEVSDLLDVIDDVGSSVYAPINVQILVPESFEYLVCCAKVGKNKDELINTFDYADASKYNSWEQYYTDYLRTLIPRYRKNKLHKDIIGIKGKILEILKEEG